MAILAIDTAGPDCSAALAEQDAKGVRLVAREAERVGRGHSDIIIPMIDRVLRSAGLDYPDLRRVAVTVGPGSFTGIRAGIAAARGFALALDIPAVGVGVLDALIAEAAGSAIDGIVVATLDARRGEIYAMAVDASGAVLLAATAAPQELVAKDLVALSSGQPVSITGSGADLLGEALAALGRSATILARAENAEIGAVARLGAAATTAVPPSPLYLRGADAKAQTGKAVARR